MRASFCTLRLKITKKGELLAGKKKPVHLAVTNLLRQVLSHSQSGAAHKHHRTGRDRHAQRATCTHTGSCRPPSPAPPSLPTLAYLPPFNTKKIYIIRERGPSLPSFFFQTNDWLSRPSASSIHSATNNFPPHQLRPCSVVVTQPALPCIAHIPWPNRRDFAFAGPLC